MGGHSGPYRGDGRLGAVKTPNLVGWPAVDQYPCVLFNLMVAVLVGLPEPLMVMSRNRETAKERHKAEMAFTVQLKNEGTIQTLVRELGAFRLQTTSRLEYSVQSLRTAVEWPSSRNG